MLQGLLGAAAIPLTAGAMLRAAAASPPQRASATNVVEHFGFVADGRTDNYDAFRRWAAHVNRVGGGDYVFPPGTYHVARHRSLPREDRSPDAVQNAEIDGVDGLTIFGHGARIRLSGAFHRSAGAGPNGVAAGTYAAMFMPFEIRRSRNISIAGFEIDGGVLDMTRDESVHETYAYLIALNSCIDVALEDLDLHHCQTDAILLSDDFIISGVVPGRACRNVRLRNVKCHHNGRGGLAALQVNGLRAVDCEFSSNGFPGGGYGWHAPGFGVDIEPDRAEVGSNIDVKTGDLEFVRCNFYDNFSAILAAYVTSFTGTCRFIDCNTRNRNNGPNHIIANWPGEGILIQGGDHDSGSGCIWLSWQGQAGSRTVLRGMNIRSSHLFGLLHGIDGNVAEVLDCTLTGTHSEASGGHFPFFGQNPGGGRRNVFRGNRVFIPAARKNREMPADVECNFHYTELSDNFYATDLAVPGEHFAFVYDPSTCSVRNERFHGAFPGKQDTFRPIPRSESHDTRVPYSVG